MEKKNSLLGEIGDIAASLSNENLRSSSVESVTDIKTLMRRSRVSL